MMAKKNNTLRGVTEFFYVSTQFCKKLPDYSILIYLIDDEMDTVCYYKLDNYKVLIDFCFLFFYF